MKPKLPNRNSLISKFKDSQKKPQFIHQLYVLAVVVLITTFLTHPLSAQIIADGNEHTVDAIAKTTDIGMPLNDEIAFITFRLVGADGGYAQVLDHIGGKVVKANGGAGTYVTATFPVGNGPNKIPPGSIFRFMEGKSGRNGSSSATAGSGFDYGGGGGGSGILYKENISSPYKILAVAGGGGGAYQGMVAGTSVNKEPGQSGRTGSSGGSGNGSSYANSGGVDGEDGGDKAVGDGGGVRTIESILRISAYTHENCDDCELPGFGNLGPDVVWRGGGTGYGCGGHGLGTLVIGGGGGGGGYSGGGFGGIYGRGGGGGSFVNPIATSQSISDQGTDDSPDHGWITYQVTLNQPPVAKCKAATISLNGNGVVTLYPLYINNGSSDPDGSIATYNLSKTSFDCDDIGPNQVTMTVTDNIGSTATCNATVTVVDPIAPTARCKNITVQLNADGVATITGADVDDGSTDNCGIESMTVVPNSFTCLNTSAPVTATLTVTDASGIFSTCISTITVEDNVPPVVSCKDITIALDPSGNASITAADIDDGSDDACGIASLVASTTSFTCDDVGPNAVTLTVTDNNGNTAICTSIVTVEDNVPPVAMCKDITVQLDAYGNASIAGADIDNGSTEACGIASLAVSPSTFTCADVGDNTVTLTVTDNNGNVSSCTSAVTVEDNIPPEALCKNITIQLDEQGEASILATDIDNGSTDACGIASLAVSPSTFTCANVGTNTVTLTVTDNNGNISSCNSSVTVEDNIPPEALCKNITIQLNEQGVASIVATDIDNGSYDACGIASLAVSPSTFTCSDVGGNTVTLTVTDNNGNVSSCTSAVTVEDNIPPEALCKNITIQLDEQGVASIVATDIDNGSSDACGIASLAVFPSTFTCSDVGGNTVTLTVTDNNGNVSSCTSAVMVEDNIPPEALCKNITIQLDEQGEASILATDIDNGSSDVCGIATYVASKTDFTCADLGNNIVTHTVTDVNGNSATCDAIVKIEDNIIPIVRTQNVTVVLDDQGESLVTVDMIDDGSTDNCTIVEMWLEGKTDYDCGDTGEHEVVLKARDQSGNIVSSNAFVKVEFYKPNFENIHGVANGDTVHQVACQIPHAISFNDLAYYQTIIQHGTLTTKVYKESLPENAPWGMYSVWRYEYVVQDACYHTYTFNYYVALYDLDPPIYQNFPNDTTVATSSDVPSVDMDVKIIDVCQYVVWDTVITMPVLDQASGDTLGYTRRWMARDPSGHQSFKDQMIWLDSGNRNQYTLITGRIAVEDHIVHARFAGEAGTNGLPVSLYRIDTVAGTRTWVSSWTTGDWMGAQGTYYFVPEQSGCYQVKIDSSICLVDTLKFDKDLWSDTLQVVAGEPLDQGLIISRKCMNSYTILTQEEVVVDGESISDPAIQANPQSNKGWRVYPNPATIYIHLDIMSDQTMNYQIFDVLGRSVKKGIYIQGQTIDVRGLNAGLYHFQLRDEKEWLGTKKVLLISDF